MFILIIMKLPKFLYTCKPDDVTVAFLLYVKNSFLGKHSNDWEYTNTTKISKPIQVTTTKYSNITITKYSNITPQ